MSETSATTCTRPRPGPMYWDWRCLNCDQAIAAHPPIWKRWLLRAGIGRETDR